MKTYAIGIARGWIELRRSKTRPKRIETSVVKPTRYREFDVYSYQFRNRRGKMTIKSVIWDGGVVVKTISTRDYTRILKAVWPRLGTIKCLTPAQIKKLIKETTWLE